MGQYAVLIIGAGRIGAFLDTPQSELVQSHAHAFSSHPGFALAGFVDANMAQAAKAVAMWGGDAFASIPDAFGSGTIDAAVIATPDETHYSLLKILAAYPLRLVFAEKPLTRSVAEAEEIVALYHKQSISLAVNFSRRFVPEVQELRARIAAGAFGEFLGGTGWYGKGTLHNGSHLIDLIHFLLGTIDDVRPVASVTDWSAEDPSCSAVLTMRRGCQFIMHAVDCRAFTIFEMDLIFERRRVRIVDSGLAIEMYAVTDNPLYPGFRDLRPAGTISTRHGNAAAFAADHLYAHLENNAPLCSTGEDGAAAQAICTTIVRKTMLMKEAHAH
jgi:predicted dehydrogenase